MTLVNEEDKEVEVKHGDLRDNEVYQELNKRKKKLLIRSILLTGFLLGVNVYAWFIFVQQFGGNIDANVVSWDVIAFDENQEQIDELALNITDLYPGMTNFSKHIVIRNRGTMPASFTYYLSSFELFGESYTFSEEESATGLNDLQNGFPFKVSFASNMNVIPASQEATFSIGATWAYESQVPYFKVNKYMKYDSEYVYYTRSGSTYTAATVDASNWNTMVDGELYMESDDADTYFGHLSSVYQTDNPGEPCLKIYLQLKVNQQTG